MTDTIVIINFGSAKKVEVQARDEGGKFKEVREIALAAVGAATINLEEDESVQIIRSK